MTTTEKKARDVDVKVIRTGGGGGDAVYGIGIFGAWAYYFRRATTTQERAAAFFKGLFWPAFLVYELLTFLGGAAPTEPRETNQE